MIQTFPWPQSLNDALLATANTCGKPLYAVGGTVRDALLARPLKDLDLVVATDAIGCGRVLARNLADSTFIVLSRERDQARVVWRGGGIDLASFRDGAASLEEDLLLRDFTVNAMAVPVAALDGCLEDALVDPAQGRRDMDRRVLVALGREVLVADPLRLLRAYRLAATLDFSLDPALAVMLAELAPLADRPAGERLARELDQIFSSPRATITVRLMAAHGVFFVLFPELSAAKGMAQPDSHHLDVLEHSLATLEAVEKILAAPDAFFPGDSAIHSYLVQEQNRLPLKWAALFHDAGKPVARRTVADRITFHHHERLGAGIFSGIAARLRWGRQAGERTARLIELHMRPLHLANAFAGNALSRRASYRLFRAAAGDLPGLFCLALADCLAAAGPGKPAGIEETLLRTWREVARHVQDFLAAVAAGPRLLTGHDLIDGFGLAPGPYFSVLLAKIEELRACGELVTSEDALRWVEDTLKRQRKEPQNG